MNLLFFLLFVSCTGEVDDDPFQPPPPPPSLLNVHNTWTSGLPFRYLMTFHACDVTRTDCMDPWLHQTFVAASNDGKKWEYFNRFEPFSSSVPDPLVRDGTLHIYALPSQRRLRLKDGKVLKSKRVEVLDENNQRVMHVDPSAIVDDKGRIVLFFLGGSVGQDPATCPRTNPNCKKIFRSATEIEGSEGLRFRLDPGIRAQVQMDQGSRYASDPDIFVGPGGFYLYVSRGQGTQVFFSKELRGDYIVLNGLPGGMLTYNGGGVGSGHYDRESGMFWTYVTKHIGQAAGAKRKTEIHMAIHKDFSRPLGSRDFRPVIRGGDFFTDNYTTASPGFFAFPDSAVR